MYKSYLYVFFIICMLFTRCSSSERELNFAPPQFKDTVELKGKVINSSFIMGLGYDIDFYKIILSLMHFKAKERKLFIYSVFLMVPT